MLTDELRHLLSETSTATIAAALQNRGIRSTFLAGLRPVADGQRMVGVAHTLRYVAMREDLRPTLLAGQNAQRRAVESLEPGEVLVIEARGVPDAGTIGDIFTMRARQRGAVGVVTDGALRDTPAIARIGLPVYHQSSHAATLSRHHLPLDHNIPIVCAGVTIFPGDVVVGDGEGVVVIPLALVAEVAPEAHRQELEDEWSFTRMEAGEATPGVFPISDTRRPDFEAWLVQREGDGS